MSAAKVLIADNQPRFLGQCAQFLERAGYAVITAHSAEDALHHLQQTNLHIAILDNRLCDDTDEQDFSGIRLARQCDPSIPKIILTAFPTWQAARDAMGLPAGEESPAVDFVSKQEGMSELLNRVRRALERVSINWNLRIDWRGGELHSLASRLNFPDQAGKLMERIGSVEDLFRKVFHDWGAVQVERVLWEESGRVALLTHMFEQGRPSQTCVMVCGRKEAILDEGQRFRKFSPKTPAPSVPALFRSAVATPFAANAYAYVSADFSNSQSLAEFFPHASERVLQAAVLDLMQSSLAAWHSGHPVLQQGDRLVQAYLKDLELGSEAQVLGFFRESLPPLLPPLLEIGIRVVSEDQRLSITTGGRINVYPIPSLSPRQQSTFSAPVLCWVSPGLCRAETIWIESSGRTLLTDYRVAGPRPVLSDFISVEAIIRFDLLGPTKPVALMALEEALTRTDLLRPMVFEVEATLRRQARAILLIRQAALQWMTDDATPYYLGLFLEVVRRLRAFGQTSQHTAESLSRLGHLVISAAMLGATLRDLAGGPPDVAAYQANIELDDSARRVFVNGVNIGLRGQSYNLLTYLYQRVGKPCERRALVEDVFHERFDPRDTSQIGRLNTAIRRLREKIEVDPDHPQYLRTEPGGGYRLSLMRDK
jgi:DNA-binding response OmpR family regulator